MVTVYKGVRQLLLEVSPSQAVDIAKASGAVSVGDFRPRKDAEVFNRHFFNDKGLEVAYYIPSLKTMLVFEQPREWGVESMGTLEMGSLN